MGTEEFADQGGHTFELPILPDIFGHTPLDLCMGVSTQRYFEEDSENNFETIEAAENEAMAEVIFKYMKEYSFLHSSPFVNDAIIKAIEISIPSIGDYLESRL